MRVQRLALSFARFLLNSVGFRQDASLFLRFSVAIVHLLDTEAKVCLEVARFLHSFREEYEWVGESNLNRDSAGKEAGH